MVSVPAMRHRRGDRHVYRNIAGEHLLIAIRGDSEAPMFALTPSGALLWKHLADWTTQEQLVELVLKEYEVTADRASADVEEFLEQLRQLRALESEGGE
jgi:hypothetical protein